jgi:hypothetical protein
MRVHEGSGLVRRCEVVHLKLDAVGVRIAVVHRCRRAMVDAPERLDAAAFQASIREEQLAQVAVREGRVVQADAQPRFALLHPRQRADGDAVMLVVVREEAEDRVLVYHPRLQQRHIPVAQPGQVARDEHEMSELARRSSAGACCDGAAGLNSGFHGLLLRANIRRLEKNVVCP